MAYKYLNDNGLKAYTKKVKGALKDLHTPIDISTLNTAESKAQNVRNITDFVAKAKAAGITDVDGMAVTCLLSSGYSGVGYLHFVDGNYTLQGVEIQEELERSTCFLVWDDGSYKNTNLITGEVTSQDLARGARNPIILTTSTTEVEEKTYQKLLSDDVDVVFKTQDGNPNLCILTYKYDDGDVWSFTFTCFSREGESLSETYFYGYEVRITKIGNPHPCEVIDNSIESQFSQILLNEGFTNRSFLSPVLQEIDLTGTDAERKDKLAQFEIYWKALTGASDMKGARFVGRINSSESNAATVLLQYNSINVEYEGISISDDIYPKIQTVRADPVQGYLTITPLFYHLEPVEIFSDNSAASKQKNIDNLNAYKSNLEQLGVSSLLGNIIPVRVDYGSGYCGFLTQTDQAYFSGIVKPKIGDGDIVSIIVDSAGKFSAQRLLDEASGFTVSGNTMGVLNHIASLYEKTKGLQAFGAIELKASDNAANKAKLTAYKKLLIDAGISIRNGYSVTVRITGNAQEYHGMLNIGTGALLTGIVTDVNETHHYPFNVNTTDGAITFDANNYFLEKTSNEVTEMLDAIKYSYTPVPLTTTTPTNKTQLDLFLSKVPNAQVMHVIYKDVYAGTLHKINESWYGVLVGESNTLAGQLSIKLQADGTIVEGTA